MTAEQREIAQRESFPVQPFSARHGRPLFRSQYRTFPVDQKIARKNTANGTRTARKWPCHSRRGKGQISP